MCGRKQIDFPHLTNHLPTTKHIIINRSEIAIEEIYKTKTRYDEEELFSSVPLNRFSGAHSCEPGGLKKRKLLVWLFCSYLMVTDVNLFYQCFTYCIFLFLNAMLISFVPPLQFFDRLLRPDLSEFWWRFAVAA